MHGAKAKFLTPIGILIFVGSHILSLRREDLSLAIDVRSLLKASTSGTRELSSTVYFTLPSSPTFIPDVMMVSMFFSNRSLPVY